MELVINILAIIGFLAVLSLVIRLLTEGLINTLNTTVNCISKIKKACLKAQTRLKEINVPEKKKKGKGVGKKAR